MLYDHSVSDIMGIPASPSIGAEALKQESHRPPCVLAGVEVTVAQHRSGGSGCSLSGPAKQGKGQISYKNSELPVITPGDRASPSPHADLSDFSGDLRVLEGSREEWSSQKQSFKKQSYSLIAETRGPWEAHRCKTGNGRGGGSCK